MKSFDEWFESQKRILYAEDDKWITKKGWEARQREVDKLQTEIDCLKIEIDGANERALSLFNHKNNMVEKMQVEIDELKGRIKYLESVKNGYRDEARELQKQINELQAMYEKQGLYAFELQKRIDEALLNLADMQHYGNNTSIENIIDILEGNQNEN